MENTVSKFIDGMFDGIVSAYSREQAIKDGVLVDLNQFISIEQSGFKFPVSCTSSVYSIIERAVENEKYGNDWEGVVWDVMYMARQRMYAGFIAGESARDIVFCVYITGAGKKRKHYFKLVCGPGDHFEPVLTIMLPEED